MRTPAITLAVLIAAAFAARPALAQTTDGKPGVSLISGAAAQTEIDQQAPPKPPPPQPKPTIPRRNPGPGVGAFVLFDNEWMTAKDTFDAVFDKADRVTAYQSGGRNSINRLRGHPDAGASISYSGSLQENIWSLGSHNAYGYGAGWNAGYTEARGWLTSGDRRLTNS